MSMFLMGKTNKKRGEGILKMKPPLHSLFFPFVKKYKDFLKNISGFLCPPSRTKEQKKKVVEFILFMEGERK